MAAHEATRNFLVSPGFGGVVFWVLTLGVLAAGVVTVMKARWGWFVVGFVTSGAFWLVSAFLPAAPDSPWARRRARRAL